MDALGTSLEALRRKRASDAVWAAADAAHLVLEAFRAAVREGTLEVAPGENPHYLFNPDAVALPAEATFAVADWAREEAFVLGVMQRSTGLEVSWKAGNRIELRAPKPEAPKPEAPKPEVSPPVKLVPAEPSCGSAEPSCVPTGPGGVSLERARAVSSCEPSTPADHKCSPGDSSASPSPADTLTVLRLLSGASPAPTWDALRVSGSLNFSAAHQTGAPPPKQSLFDRMFGPTA